MGFDSSGPCAGLSQPHPAIAFVCQGSVADVARSVVESSSDSSRARAWRSVRQSATGETRCRHPRRTPRRRRAIRVRGFADGDGAGTDGQFEHVSLEVGIGRCGIAAVDANGGAGAGFGSGLEIFAAGLVATERLHRSDGFVGGVGARQQVEAAGDEDVGGEDPGRRRWLRRRSPSRVRRERANASVAAPRR